MSWWPGAPVGAPWNYKHIRLLKMTDVPCWFLYSLYRDWGALSNLQQGYVGSRLYGVLELVCLTFVTSM